MRNTLGCSIRRLTAVVLAFTSFLFLTTATAAKISVSSGDYRTPVVELYTSEGCSSCPPADAWISKLGDALNDDFHAVPLAFHVDYWNYLGWEDPFSRSEFTTRQRELLIEVGHACRKADRLEQAIDSLTRALGLARHAGDESAEADILYHLGTISFSAGDMHQASKYHQAAVEICNRLGNVNLIAVQAYHGRGEAYFSLEFGNCMLQDQTSQASRICQ